MQGDVSRKAIWAALNIFIAQTVLVVLQENLFAADDRLEEVIVTAQKREQNIQDIALTVSAFTGQEIRDLGVDNIQSLLELVPGTGFFDVTGGGVPVIVVRGVGLQNFRVNDTPTTAVYVDEVYQTSVAEASFSIFDLESISLLKGPQGGLYGRNAVGGAIQVESKRPNFEETDGYLSAGYGKYGRIETEGAAGGPLSSNVAARISARYVRSDDTYFHNVFGGYDHGEEDKWAARGQLSFRPSDSSEFLLKVHGGADNSETPLLRPVGIYAPSGLGIAPGISDGVLFNAAGIAPSLANVCTAILAGGRGPSTCETLNGLTLAEMGVIGKYDSASSIRPRLNNSWWGASLIAKFSFDNYTLTSISAYDDFDHGRLIDFEGVPTEIQNIDYNSKITAWSQEFRLAYEGGGNLSWLLGVNYAEDKLDEATILTTLDGLVPFAFGVTESFQDYLQKTKAFAGYGRGDLTFGNGFNFFLEARYTDVKKSLDGGNDIGGVIVVTTNDSKTFNSLSGKLGLEWQPTDDTLLYATISRGFKTGGFFGGFALSAAQLEPFDEETILAYETGFKTDFRQANLRLNGSLFYYDRKDVQATGFDTTGLLGISRLTNIGTVESKGAELETLWFPVEELRLKAAATYVKSEVVKSDKTKADLYLSTTMAPFKGARMPNQPEFSAVVSGRYETQLSQQIMGSLELEYSYQSDQDLSFVVIPEELPILRQDAYGLVNLRATVGNTNRSWSLNVFVTNLFNKTFRTTAGNDGGIGGVYEIYGPPRIYGVVATHSF